MGKISGTVAAMLAVVIMSCSSTKDPGAGATSGTSTATMSETGDRAATKAAGLRTYEGYLEIAPIVTGKAEQAVVVHTKEGRRVAIAIRYRPEHLKYVNKRVVVTGGMSRTSSDPRAQSASYFKVSSIRLAPGERPYARVPIALPHAPVVRSEKAIAALPGGWGLAMGTARYVRKNPGKGKPGPSVIVEKVTVTLTDGFAITHHLHHMISADSPEYKDGERVTLLFRYMRNWSKKITPVRFCHGEYVWCGMRRRPLKHTLGRLIKGGYSVFEGKVRLGFLQLWGDNYRFTPSKQKPSKALRARFSFFQKPEGRATLSYAKGVNPKSELSSFARDAIVATVIFNGQDAWLIRVGDGGKRLYFHSRKSELQTWRIEKAFVISPVKGGVKKARALPR